MLKFTKGITKEFWILMSHTFKFFIPLRLTKTGIEIDNLNMI